MRIFKYWIRFEKEIFIDGKTFYLKVLGGSNISAFDAKKDAEKKIGRIRLKIQNKAVSEEYQADIVEEIIHTIDHQNIITRNRYGALVLNSENLLFIDIDQLRFSFYDLFFRGKLTKKQKLLLNIEKTIKKKKYARFGFRLYETANGFRLLVSNQDFKAQSLETKRIMEDFGVDRMYMWLCIKQNCFRARLTPKPFRIKQKAIKVKYPERTTQEAIQLSNWLAAYDHKSQRYSTCKLVKTYGKPMYDKAISYHDRMTKINYNNKLA